METAWLFERLAVTVARVDFLDPALVGTPAARERGVRVEVRRVEAVHEGSVYASPSRRLEPALCRIDLLESEPHAADRMHWHPAMREGEPGDRIMDAAIGEDPLGWLGDRLADLGELFDAEGLDDDLVSVRRKAPEIVACAESGMAWARVHPWPEVTHDERGLAPNA